MKKRLFSLFLFLVLMLGLLPARSMAAPTASGECGAQGSNLTWRLEDGVLTVPGSLTSITRGPAGNGRKWC